MSDPSNYHKIPWNWAVLHCIGCKPVDPVSGPIIFKSYLESLLLQNKQPEIVLIIISNESYVSYFTFCYSSWRQKGLSTPWKPKFNRKISANAERSFDKQKL